MHPPTQSGGVGYLDRENDDLLRDRKEQFPGHTEGLKKSDIVGGAAGRRQNITLSKDKKCANWRGGGLDAIHDNQTSDILYIFQKAETRTRTFAENDLSRKVRAQFPRHRAPEGVVGEQIIAQAQHANRFAQGFPF